MFGDIGIGILLSIFVTHLFGVDLTIYHIIGGILFALLPDIDMLIFVIPGLKKLFNGHREWTHHPLKYISLTILVFFVAGPVWALLFFLCILFHFIHDSLWIGNGIAWLGPYSKKRYKFFNIEKPYTPGPITWIRDFYLRPTVVSVTELGIFIVSISVLYMYLT